MSMITRFEVTQTIATASEWWYFGRRFSYPKYNFIALDSLSTGYVAIASDVFEMLKLDPVKLAEIFERGYCLAEKTDSWSKLAQLSGKTIHWFYNKGEFSSREVAIYYPDGRVENPTSK